LAEVEVVTIGVVTAVVGWVVAGIEMVNPVVVVGRIVVGGVEVVPPPPPQEATNARLSTATSKIPSIFLFIFPPCTLIAVKAYTAICISATRGFLNISLLNTKNTMLIAAKVATAPTVHVQMFAGYSPMMVSVPNHFSRYS
jgi:hypothetical protein